MIWKTLQATVLLWDSKYVIVATMANQIIWIIKLRKGLEEEQVEATIIACDNKYAIYIVEN